MVSIDWKAVSHAVRYASQLEELFTTGDITFPLKGREFIAKIKAGELDYTSVVAPYLHTLIDAVEIEASLSIFPEKSFQFKRI